MAYTSSFKYSPRAGFVLTFRPANCSFLPSVGMLLLRSFPLIEATGYDVPKMAELCRIRNARPRRAFVCDVPVNWHRIMGLGFITCLHHHDTTVRETTRGAPSSRPSHSASVIVPLVFQGYWVLPRVLPSQQVAIRPVQRSVSQPRQYTPATCPSFQVWRSGFSVDEIYLPAAGGSCFIQELFI